jgi:hypothetical protein
MRLYIMFQHKRDARCEKPEAGVGIKTLGMILLTLGSLYTKGQIIKTKLDIVGGISAREYIHGGIRYQYTDFTQLGIYYGGYAGQDITIHTYSADNMIHFGKRSYHSNRPVWYARQGFTYDVGKEADRTRKFSYIDIALGREFSINDWLGVNLDMGLLMQVREKQEWKAPGLDSIYDNFIYWLPLFRLQVFFSL